jgi:hypothetical protein
VELNVRNTFLAWRVSYVFQCSTSAELSTGTDGHYAMAFDMLRSSQPC